MTQTFYIRPSIDVRTPADQPAKLARKPPAIPSMHAQRHKRAHDDATVTAAVLAHLRGEPYPSIAQRIGAKTESVRDWCEGITRAGCGMEALRLWRNELAGCSPPTG